MVSDEEFVTKTSKGEELDGKKAPGRTGAERTGKMSRRACYFEGCVVVEILKRYIQWRTARAHPLIRHAHCKLSFMKDF